MKTKRLFTRLACVGLSVSFFVSGAASAKTFNLPAPNDSVIGSVQYSTAGANETIPLFAQRYNLGQNAIIAANPGFHENGSIPSGSTVAVPTEYLLPNLPRQGIIVNLPEMRLYYFPKGTNTVMIFPIGIGKIGKTIPIKNTIIARKVVNPTWTPPADIIAFNREQGVNLPRAMGPGPDNPLGPYAIYLGIPTYLIHSTIFPESIGRRASFGCIRMNEDDIRTFFPIVQKGIPVVITDMPNKFAWQGDRLYLEAHPPLEERSNEHYATLSGMVNAVQQTIPKQHVVFVNWQMLSYLSDHPDGIPHEVGVKVN